MDPCGTSLFDGLLEDPETVVWNAVVNDKVELEETLVDVQCVEIV